MNQYPLWKYLLISITIAIAALYALPTLYGEYPVVQVSAVRGAAIDEATQASITTVLKGAGIDVADMEQLPQGLVIKFSNTYDADIFYVLFTKRHT